MQARGAALAPGILFDCDMGRDIDTALALSTLCGLGRGRLIAVGVSNSSLDAAAFCDAVTRFYGIGGSLPVGLAENGHKLENPRMLKAALDLRNPDGQPTFRTTVRSIIDTGDPPVVFRNALLTQQDMQGIVVMAGPATNLARMLSLGGAREIIASKVRLLVMGAGAFESSSVDPRIGIDTASARKVLADWPSPIIAVGVEAGKAVAYSNAVFESDFGQATNHPVGVAYRTYREGQADPQISAQSVLAALYAADSAADHFKLSQSGSIEVSSDGRTVFRASSSGKHRHLLMDTAQKDAIAKAFVTLATTRPAGGRGGPARD